MNFEESHSEILSILMWNRFQTLIQKHFAPCYNKDTFAQKSGRKKDVT